MHFAAQLMGASPAAPSLVAREADLWRLFELKRDNLRTFKERIMNARRMKNVLHQIVHLLEKSSDQKALSDTGANALETHLRQMDAPGSQLTDKTREKVFLDLESMFDECSDTLLETMGRAFGRDAGQKHEIRKKMSNVQTRLFSKIDEFSTTMAKSGKSKKLPLKTHSKKQHILKQAKYNLVYLLDSDIKKVLRVTGHAKETLIGIKLEITKAIKQILRRAPDEDVGALENSLVFYAFKLRQIGHKVSRELLFKFSEFEISYIKRMSKALLIRHVSDCPGSKLLRSIRAKYGSSLAEQDALQVEPAPEKRVCTRRTFRELYARFKQVDPRKKMTLSKSVRTKRRKKLLRAFPQKWNQPRKVLKTLQSRLRKELCPRRVLRQCRQESGQIQKSGDATAHVEFEAIESRSEAILASYYRLCLGLKNCDKEQILNKMRLILGAPRINAFCRKHRFYELVEY